MNSVIDKILTDATALGRKWASMADEREVELVQEYAEIQCAFETADGTAALQLVQSMMPSNFAREDAVEFWQDAGFDKLPKDYVVEAFVEGALESSE